MERGASMLLLVTECELRVSDLLWQAPAVSGGAWTCCKGSAAPLRGCIAALPSR
jgi:hypothetical protein